MAKKNDEIETSLDVVATELERIHPENGDVFILNVNSDDPSVIYSDEVTEGVEKLAEVLNDITGLEIPILVFGKEISLNLLTKAELGEIVEQLESLEDDEVEEEDNEDEHLTEQFS